MLRLKASCLRASASVFYSNSSSRLDRSWWLLGGLSFGLALFSALRDGEKASAWLVALGGTGGLLFGLVIFFGTSVRQWSIIREFLNVEAIREAGRQQDL